MSSTTPTPSYPTLSFPSHPTQIAEASLDPSVPAPPSGTFVAVDFYRHATVVSSVGLGSNPRYGSTLQFIVEPSLDFLRHLDGAAARVDLCQPDGFGFATLGRGLLPLRKYLETALRGQATTPVTLYVDVVGADRKAVARVRVRVRMARPLPRPIVDDYVVMRQREARDAARSGGAVAEAVALVRGRWVVVVGVGGREGVVWGAWDGAVTDKGWKGGGGGGVEKIW